MRFDNADTAGTLLVGGECPSDSPAIEVLAGIGKSVTANSVSNNGLLARPYSSNAIAVDKWVLPIPASSRLKWLCVVQAYRYIEWASKNPANSDETIVSRAKSCLMSSL